MVTVAYKYKVYRLPKKTLGVLDEYLRIACQIYNHVVQVHKRYYKIFGGYVSPSRMKSHIAKLRRRNVFWQMIDSQSVQQIVEKVHLGYEAFFNRTNRHTPKCRASRKYRSVTFKQSGWKLNGNDFYVTGLGLRLPFFHSRPIEGKIQTVTLKRDSVGDWWLVFTVRKEADERNLLPRTGKTAGMDFGLKHFLTLDNGRRIDCPEYYKRSLRRIRGLSRSLSRKTPTPDQEKAERQGRGPHPQWSKNTRRACEALSREYRRIDNLRHEWFFSLSYSLCREYDTIRIEDLNLEGMKRLWGRKVSDYAFSEFVSVLEHVCAKTGKTLEKVDRWYASTKRCSVCGHQSESVPLRVRAWTCPECGTRHDRDVNAARNIRNYVAGASATEPRACKTGVSLPRQCSQELQLREARIPRL